MAHPTTSSPSRRMRQRTADPSASHTITQTITTPSSGRLILRGATEESPAESSQPPRVQWAEDVVDNEHLGRKSSKVCCIYHRPHDPDGPSDSSDSSDNSSEDDSESSGEDLDMARSVRRSRARRKQHRHHDHDHDCDGQHDDGSGNDVQDVDKQGKGKGKVEKKTINAYERMPKYTEAGRKQAEEK